MRNIKNNLGFTLIETIVALGIFAMISTLIYANFRQGEKQEELSQSALELADNLRKVQNLGMSGQVTKYCQAGSEKEFQACANDSDCGAKGDCDYGVPRGGYGVYFDQEGALKSYTLFIDLSGDLKYDETGVKDDVLPGGKDYQLKGEVVVLEYELRCAFLTSWSCPVAHERMDVLFMPPKPTPWANGYEEEQVYILLKHTEIEKCAQVSVNGFSGDVSVESLDECSIKFN